MRLKIGLALTERNSHCEALLRLLPFLGGSTYTESPAEIVGLDAAEVAIIHMQSPLLPQWEERTDRPYILVDSKDGADLATIPRKLLQGNRPPAAIWKKSRYAHPELYNHFHGRWHVELMRLTFDEPDGLPAKLPRPIPRDRLDRIRAPITFASFGHPLGVLQRSLSDELLEHPKRPFDVTFAGTTDYDGSLVEKHRKLAVQAIKALPHSIHTDCYEKRALDLDDYAQLLLNSKCVICPAGWGEMTYRHYEALYAGAIPISAIYAHVDEWQTPFQCRFDWSDLPEQVEAALDCWHSGRDDRLHWRQALIARNDPRAIGRELWTDLQQAASPSAQEQPASAPPLTSASDP